VIQSQFKPTPQGTTGLQSVELRLKKKRCHCGWDSFLARILKASPKTAIPPAMTSLFAGMTNSIKTMQRCYMLFLDFEKAITRALTSLFYANISFSQIT
jgi:hypothetical protein